jgi:hypothetical protein
MGTTDILFLYASKLRGCYAYKTWTWYNGISHGSTELTNCFYMLPNEEDVMLTRPGHGIMV